MTRCGTARARVARASLLANRIGYLLFAVAVAVFVIGFAVGFTGAIVAIVVAALVVGSLLLAPADRARLRDQGRRARQIATTAADRLRVPSADHVDASSRLRTS